MSVRVLLCHEQGDWPSHPDKAILFDSVTGVPLTLELFSDQDDTTAEELAEAFMQDAEAYFGADLRAVDAGDLYGYQIRWRRAAG